MQGRLRKGAAHPTVSRLQLIARFFPVRRRKRATSLCVQLRDQRPTRPRSRATSPGAIISSTILANASSEKLAPPRFASIGERARLRIRRDNVHLSCAILRMGRYKVRHGPIGYSDQYGRARDRYRSSSRHRAIAPRPGDNANAVSHSFAQGRSANGDYLKNVQNITLLINSLTGYMLGPYDIDV